MIGRASASCSPCQPLVRKERAEDQQALLSTFPASIATRSHESQHGFRAARPWVQGGRGATSPSRRSGRHVMCGRCC